MRLVRNAMTVMHSRHGAGTGADFRTARKAAARPATEHNTTFTSTASPVAGCGRDADARSPPSSLVLRADHHLRIAIDVHRDRDHDRPAAHLAVLDVLLVAGGVVDEQFDRFAAVRAPGVD